MKTKKANLSAKNKSQEEKPWETQRAEKLIALMTKLVSNSINFSDIQANNRLGIEICHPNSQGDLLWLYFDCSMKEFEKINDEINYVLEEKKEQHRLFQLRQDVMARLSEDEKKALNLFKS